MLLGVLLNACILNVRAEGPCVRNPNEQDGSILRMLIDGAVRSGASRVVIPPGTYRLNYRKDLEAHVSIKGARNLEIVAEGVLILADQPLLHPLVTFRGCVNVTLRGLSVDCDPVAFTQGRVTGFAPNREWIDVQIDAGYETDPKKFGQFRPMSVFERDGKTWKLGCPDANISSVECKGERMWRVSLVKGRQYEWPVAVGDPVVIPGFGMEGVSFRNCEGMKLIDVTVYQSGSMAFHEHGGIGGTLLSGCKVMRRPGTDRLISTNADGFHCVNMRRGPVVENCSFEGMQDDGINIHGMYGKVGGAPSDGVVHVIPCYENTANPGDHMEFFSARTGASLGVHVLKTVRQLESDTAARRAEFFQGHGNGLLYAYTFEETPPVEKMDLLINLNACGSGFVVRNNIIRDIRYRGLLLRGGPGIVEGNRCASTGSSGIVGTTDDLEGPYCRDLILRDNTVTDAGRLPFVFSGFGIMITSGLGGFGAEVDKPKVKNVIVANNRVDGALRDGIRIENAQNVILSENTVSASGSRPLSGAKPAAIQLINCRNVIRQDNRIEQSAAGSEEFVEKTNQNRADWDWRGK